LRAVWPRTSNGDAVAVTLHRGNVRVDLQHEFLPESRDGVSTDLRIADRADAAATTEHRNIDTETMECLTQFQANDPWADHGHCFGQILPVEYVVADDQTIAQGLA
jgi:hypothetical protein